MKKIGDFVIILCGVFYGVFFLIGFPVMWWDLNHGSPIEKWINNLEKYDINYVATTDYIVKTAPKLIIGAVVLILIAFFGLVILIDL